MNSVSALLVVSFGTSYPETRARTIDAIEGALQDAFPGHRLYRAWTSGMIRKKLLSRDGERISSVDEAMEQMALDGVTHVVVQPTHLLEGAEYDKVVNAVRAQADKFASVLVGAPLLAEALAGALEEAFSHLRPDELLALMGHGSAHMGFPAYSALEAYFHRDGWANVAIGTVEFSPGIGPVLQQGPGPVHVAVLRHFEDAARARGLPVAAARLVQDIDHILHIFRVVPRDLLLPVRVSDIRVCMMNQIKLHSMLLSPSCPAWGMKRKPADSRSHRLCECNVLNRPALSAPDRSPDALRNPWNPGNAGSC